MRILIVGSYGFIGRAVAEALQRRGHDIIGWGRSATIGRRILPDATWIEGDLTRMVDAAGWQAALFGIDAVVNASGALQDGAGGDLQQVQGRAITALVDACEATGIRRFVQISAVGAVPDADTQFLATKAVADAHLRSSPLAWTILRPALVIDRNAYGGTALIRALAALPIALTVYGRSPIQCVALDDVAAVCADAVEGATPAGRDQVLAADERLSLQQVIALHRRWLGLPPASFALDLPPLLSAPIAKAADLAGWLGWRSPLRSTALRVMRGGVLADGETGCEFAPLARILAANPSGMQDRVAARLFLLLPIILIALAGLWIGSGITGLAESHRAAALIGGGHRAEALVQGCAAIDLLLGCAILVRRWARTAALLMVLVSIAYLVGGSVITPGLWLDPLAPLLKIVPSLALALLAAALLDRR
jgi:uncharacterized protein YbjT (DUF2867 family)